MDEEEIKEAEVVSETEKVEEAEKIEEKTTEEIEKPEESSKETAEESKEELKNSSEETDIESLKTQLKEAKVALKKAKKAQKAAEEESEEYSEEEYHDKYSHATKGQFRFAIILSIISLLVGGFGLYYGINGRNGFILLGGSTDGNSANFTDGSMADVASKVSPSVVSITTETRTQTWYGAESGTAAGTGFIVSEDGYIVTNKHVVEKAKTVNVTLDNGTEYKDVEVIGTDPLNDVAILKIKDVADLPAVKLGNSTTINAGQQVLVIGNALGQYQNSVTYGIVSGTGRSLIAADSTGSSYERLTDMIQTDAAINGGNSGGPLVNAAGEVIGIATAYASSSNTVGFAIPITAIKGVIKNVEKTGKFERAVLGVYYTMLDKEKAETYKLDVSEGAYVYNDDGDAIIKDSAGEKAGLKKGDIIISVNGTKLGKAGSLGTVIGEYAVGETVKLGILRDGKTITLEVTLEAYKN